MTTKWKADPVHTEIQFTAKHLMLTTVTGYFREFDLEVETEDEDFKKASGILFIANINSINTNNAQRDAHLKSSDFFAAEEYGELKFEGKGFKKHAANYLLSGDLTIRNVTRPIEVEVEYGGIITDPWGQKRAGFTVEGKINRKDFNLTWDAATEAGQIVVSNEIKIHCAVELVKQAIASPIATEQAEHIEA
ncbi:MAG TPA: YceI family protein [Chitinophagaceae bacterium]|nr:YceI family protein [Chitinophagaceae bacterium]